MIISYQIYKISFFKYRLHSNEIINKLQGIFNIFVINVNQKFGLRIALYKRSEDINLESFYLIL
jgi:hypothetical protein